MDADNIADLIDGWVDRLTGPVGGSPRDTPPDEPQIPIDIAKSLTILSRMDNINVTAETAENIRLAEVLGRDAIANIHYDDDCAPNAAYCVARCAAHFAALALDEKGGV